MAPDLDLIAVDAALNELTARDPAKAKLVELRFFAGLTMPRVAEVLGVSLATAERQWAYVRAWLLAELGATDRICGRRGVDSIPQASIILLRSAAPPVAFFSFSR